MQMISPKKKTKKKELLLYGCAQLKKGKKEII
jgi:hypothetical protein